MAVTNSRENLNEVRDEIIHKLSQPMTALQLALELALTHCDSAREYEKAIQAAFERPGQSCLECEIVSLYKKALESALEEAHRMAKLLQELSENVKSQVRDV